jgi:hypothetical protein
MLNIETLRNKTEQRTTRSAWSHGVEAYAHELIDEYEEARAYNEREARDAAELEKWMLNGASDWNEYSWGGCSLIYNGDIAERLCTPSELKKTRNGARRPNNREEWLDTQARALYQAARRVKNAFREMLEESAK